MTDTFIGIDPGVNGAVAVIEDGGLMLVEHLPTMQPHKRRELDTAALRDVLMFCQYLSPLVCIERVSSMPGQGVAAVFSFGRAFGQIEGLVTGLGFRYTLVTPQTWKKETKTPRSKDGAKMRASQLFPGDTAAWPLVKDHNKCEAVLIAYYASRS